MNSQQGLASITDGMDLFKKLAGNYELVLASKHVDGGYARLVLKLSITDGWIVNFVVRKSGGPVYENQSLTGACREFEALP